MPMDNKSIIMQINKVLMIVERSKMTARFKDLSDLGEEKLAELVALMADTIRRFAPIDSEYRSRSVEVLTRWGVLSLVQAREQLSGILNSLKVAYENGFLESVQELIHADLFGDFLEMAIYLLGSGFKDPAAMLTGAILEEHLRKLCLKNGVAITFPDGKNKMINQMNTDLYTSKVYSKPEMLQVTAWGAIRNCADHGQFADYTGAQVDGMIQGILTFFARFPA